jgi:hypothetical protein
MAHYTPSIFLYNNKNKILNFIIDMTICVVGAMELIVGIKDKKTKYLQHGLSIQSHEWYSGH